MILDAQGNKLVADGEVVGKAVEFEVFDGVVPDIPHPSLSHVAGKEYRPGVPDFGTVTIRFYRDTTDPGQEAIADSIKNRTIIPCELHLQNGRVISFQAYGKVVPITGLIDNVNTSRCALKITGAPTDS